LRKWVKRAIAEFASGLFEPAGGAVRDVCGLGARKRTGKSLDYAKPAVDELAAHVAKVKRTRNITLRRKNGCLWVRNADS